MRKTLCVAAPAAAALAITPTTASAEPLQKWHDTDQGTDSFDCDGRPVNLAWSFDVNGLVNPHGPDGLAHWMETVHGRFVWTNAATGKSLTLVRNAVFKVQQVVDNGDGSLTVTGLGTGSDKVYGPDGKQLFKNPGQVRWQVLFNHAGTPSDPSDDEVVADLGLVKGSTGRNDLVGVDFCDVFLEVTG